MRIIQLKDKMLKDVAGGIVGVPVVIGGEHGFPTPYDTVLVNNGTIFVALNKTDAGLNLNLGGLDILQENDKVLIVKP